MLTWMLWHIHWRVARAPQTRSIRSPGDNMALGRARMLDVIGDDIAIGGHRG